MEIGVGYEKLVSAIIERYELKQDKIEQSMQEFRDATLSIYSKIESDVKLLSSDVSYLVKVIRDGNDPISNQIVDHESRINALEEKVRKEDKETSDSTSWKRAAVTSVILALIGAVTSVVSVFFKK